MAHLQIYAFHNRKQVRTYRFTYESNHDAPSLVSLGYRRDCDHGITFVIEIGSLSLTLTPNSDETDAAT